MAKLKLLSLLALAFTISLADPLPPPGLQQRILNFQNGGPLDLLPQVSEQDWIDATDEDAEAPMVDVPSMHENATVVGKVLKSYNGRDINAFQGIRYATVEKRFMHSELVEEYDEGEIRANHLGPKCVQSSPVGDFSGGSKDCLFLNVYVPADADTTKLLPVMVFIHGGSFTSGDASLYMPTRLLDQDVILVVIQYRLGALGWLSLQNDDIPGNAGLSDQMNSLRWVQKHIEDFGGDPDLVTVFGQSAGSTSVSLIQTVAPKGLFSGVIAESGSALEYWAIDPYPLQSAQMFAESCNCQFTGPATQDAIYDCLMNDLDEYEISDCSHDFVSMRRGQGIMGFEAVSPVVQTEDVSEKYRLIKKEPQDIIVAGEALDVPVMMGANRDEGSYIFGVMYLSFLYPKNLTTNADYIANKAIPDILNSFGVQDQTKTISKALQKEYIYGVDTGNFSQVTPGMIDLTGVLFIKGGTYQTAVYHSQLYASNTFFYSFDFESEDSVFNWLFSGEDTIPFDGGITHADELMYLFSLPSHMNEEQVRMKDILVRMWTNFAKNRDPTPENDKELEALGLTETWEPLTDKNKHYYLIQRDVTLESDYTMRWHTQMDRYLSENEDVTTTTPSTPPAEEEVSFLAPMIVFIVAFVISSGAAVYFYFKAR